MPLDRARFEARVDRCGLHHIWLGAKSPGGGGQVRIDGKLLTAARAAWEIENGAVPDGVRVLSCADEPACVRVDHLRLDQRAISSKSPPSKKRSPRGAGTITAISPGVWKIGVTAGVDRLGQRRRTFRTIYGTRQDAATALAALVTEVGDGHRLVRQHDKQLTLDSLVAWYLEFAREDLGLDHSTLTGYADAYSHWLKEPIGHKRASSITTADIDTAFDRMRRAGLSRSRMNNTRALLSGAFKWGKRHRKVTSNPVDRFELPPATHAPRHTTAPELDELLRLLATAAEHDELLAPVLNLAATTGLRRGELSGLRRDRLHLNRQELIVDTAINDAGGIAEATLREASTRIATDYAIEVRGVIGDFRRHLYAVPTDGVRLFAFLGGTVGNFEPAERAALLSQIAAAMVPDDALLLGTDLVKDHGRLVRAYDDSAGVTAAFNKNVLSVLNYELGADFYLDDFDHVALFDTRQEWIEMRLRSRRRHTVHVPGLGLTLQFEAGEELRTKISSKFRVERIGTELAMAGLRVADMWTDPAGDFALTLAVL